MFSMENTNKNGGNRNKPTYDVFVGHVPKSLPKGKLELVFSKYGVLVDILYRCRDNAFGYAIVKFKYQKDAVTVLREMNTINISGYEMEVRQGKMSNNSIENGDGGASMMKTVTFAEPMLNIPPMENAYFMEPILYDANYGACITNENEHFPIMVDMMCTHVENAVSFYGCVINKFEELQNLSMKLNSICPNLQRLLRKPALKKVYGALFEDLAWYRCSVIQCTVPLKPGLCIVQYIDYGNIAEVCYTNMVELPEPLKNLTPFAVKCVFSNLMCNPRYLNNVSYLHKLLNQRMTLYAMSSWGILEFQVLKCSCNGIDVIAELIKTGSAMYRTHMSANSPPLIRPNRNEKGGKYQDNHKPKKAKSAKANKKVGNACNGANIEDVCNGDKKSGDACNDAKEVGGLCNRKVGNASNSVVKHFSEVNNNDTVQDQVSICKNSSEACQLDQEFIPKKIIKRGGNVTSVVNLPVLEGQKTVNNMLKVDCVISNLKLINNVRALFPLHTDDDLINDSINFLQNEANDISDACDSKNHVEKAYQEYCHVLKALKECSDQALLLDLKEKRELQRVELLNELKIFFETFDNSLLQNRKKIQEIITALESNSNAWMNLYLAKTPQTLEDLLVKYNQEKEKKVICIEKARENTNEKHTEFQKLLGDLQKEFSLNMVDGNVDESYFVSTGGKRGSWALKFEETLTELGLALEAESKASTMVKEKNGVSVVNCILEKLDVPKEKIDAECELFEKYNALYDDLNNTSDLSPIFKELYSLQKNIQEISLHCVCNGDPKKVNNVLLDLHTAMLRENTLLENIAKASSLHFPELVLEHPGLKLYEYQKNSCLLKFNWEERFFPSFEDCNRIEPSYISKLAGEPVVIKEFKISCDLEKGAFMKKAVTWNEIRSKSLVKIKALFANKGKTVLYAVLPPIWKTLYDEPLSIPVDYKMALNLLQQILIGLCDIHSRGIAHGAVHPLAILHKDGEILLDFNFDEKYLQDKFCLKGINFKVPRAEDLYKSADMYGFGCLVLWVLFPNLSFNSTDQGVPDLNAFQSIIQELLSAKDFASLSALLNFNQDLRPSSRVLLSNGFLKDLSIVS